ncbi:MAG: anaerobic ribonucleoside-triphosphate reductase activating protein [Desulfotomaculaceae bacterium]|nr:anaerobic ribonucleoside-triphosphate reductase activating protein [Desulfotomaculaceae bacterium]
MNTLIRVAGLIPESIVDGPGIRFVVFAQGCRHNCPGCHNPETHSFTGGHLVDINSILQQMRDNRLLDGITLSGGEPFEQAAAFAELAKKAKTFGYNVMTYTGYTYECILDGMNERAGWANLIKSTDILVDGKFDQARKSLLLPFRGSANQRIIDVKESFRTNKIIILSFQNS